MDYIWATSECKHVFLPLVMTHCQIYSIPGVTYVGITENHDIDSRTLAMFTPLLNVEPLGILPKVSL